MGQKLVSFAFMGIMAGSGGYAMYQNYQGAGAPVADGRDVPSLQRRSETQGRVDMRSSSLGSGTKAFFSDVFRRRRYEIQSRSSSGGGGSYGK